MNDGRSDDRHVGADGDDRRNASDDELLDDLAWALSDEEPVPEHVTAAARDAFAWRRADAALAELIESSAPAGVRGRAARHMRFTTPPSWRVEVDLHQAQGRSIATGRLSPAVPASVTWESPRGVAEPVDVSDDGLFELDGLPRGPLRFVVSPHDEPSFSTDWVVA